MDYTNGTINAVLGSGLESGQTFFKGHRHITSIVLSSLVTSLIALVSITGNLAVLAVSVCIRGPLRANCGNIFVAYLANNDVLTAVFVMIPSAIAVAMDRWPFGAALCSLHGVCNYTFACSSMVSIAVISIDRALAILFPLKYVTIMTKRLVFFLCSVIFLISCVTGITNALKLTIRYDYTEAVCAAIYTDWSEDLIFATNVNSILCFYTPFTTIIVCYLMIFVSTKRERKLTRVFVIRSGSNMGNVSEAIQNENYHKKSIKSLLIVIATFYILFLLYVIIKCIKVFGGKELPLWINQLSQIFIFISSAVNPFIYAILRKDYRKSFKYLYKRIKRYFFH